MIKLDALTWQAVGRGEWLGNKSAERAPAKVME